eukprot:TRINITY_DN95266_c0_g1_i1.p1 TRINITY_DN95266_c0_g1~~TRINITY_DN95266_c0_g1_i1.p1  ORF type:complete len:653 (-),score=126.86 TRINITY_DN95266_c0_g1_i1:262-2220(-)
MPLEEFKKRFTLLVQKYVGASLACKAAGVKNMSEDSCASHRATALAAIKSKSDSASCCRALMKALSDSSDERYAIGRTRVYFKSGVLESLEERRALLMQAAAMEVGRIIRGRQVRRRFEHQRKLALRLQALRRMRKARAAYQRARDVIVACQGLRRAVLARRRVEFLRRQRCATHIQSCWRRQVARRRFARARCAAVLLQSRARARMCRRQFLLDLKEFKEQAKLENQIKALQAKLEAQEKASKENVATVVVNEPPTEVLEALQALRTENAKLRVDVEQLRAENAKLRHENRELQAKDATREEMLASFKRSKRYDLERSSTASTRDDSNFTDGESSSSSSRSAGSSGRSRSSSIRETPEALQLFPPLAEFWEDVPFCGLPLLMNGSRIHIKLGPNILLVDMHGKHLVWKGWMHQQRGYRRSMTFIAERPKPQKTTNWLGSAEEDKSASEAENTFVGETFVLRSALTQNYVKVGGLLDWYRLLVTGQDPSDAAIFSAQGPFPGISGDGATFFFGLKLAGQNKIMCLRDDGSIAMDAISPADQGKKKSTIAAAVECLLPATSYDILVQEQHIGLTVSKDLPLRVVGFKDVVNEATKMPEPGPAERTGRVQIGDVITTVNGQDISALPRRDAIDLINARRPLQLGFKTASADFSC